MEEINKYRMERAKDYWLSNPEDSDYQYIDNLLRQYEAIRKKYEGESSEYLNSHRLELQEYLRKNSKCVNPHLAEDRIIKAGCLVLFISEMTGIERVYLEEIWDQEDFDLAENVFRKIKKDMKVPIDFRPIII